MFACAKKNDTRNNNDPFQIPVCRQRPSIRPDALHRRDTYGRLLTCLLWKNTCSLFASLVPSRSACYSAHARCAPCAAQHVPMPTIILIFREENFRDPKSNHEIHENIVPRKFGAIRYWYSHLRRKSVSISNLRSWFNTDFKLGMIETVQYWFNTMLSNAEMILKV